LPPDIPVAPDHAYRDKGWISLGDWLGTGTVATFLRDYQLFEEARAFARTLDLKSSTEWLEYCKTGKLPSDIPANPGRVYRDEGWLGMGDWLGTGYIAPRLRKYRPFKAARAFARSLGLKSSAEWVAFTKSGKLPPDIPAYPRQTYIAQGWSGFGDWLGTGYVYRREYRDIKEARAFARRLGLKSLKDWQAFCRSGKRPSDIPSNPQRTYKNQGWAGWRDWLATDTKSKNHKA
jgi:hypothetical protein